jgi:protein-tyrosine kinase
LTIDDKRIHLIERAAARLRQPAAASSAPAAADPSAVAALERADSHRVSRIEPGHGLRENWKRPAAIDAAALAKAGLIDWDQRGTRIVEELRIAQNNLLRHSFGDTGTVAARSGNLVMITSALAGEGKSFISLNLAAGVARQAERRVMLIDTDTRPNSLGQTFGLSTAPGLLDLAREGEFELEDLLVPTAAENLAFLPLGSGGGEPLSRARIAELVADIGRRHGERLIILDAAPCLSSSDPHTLAPIMGQTVLVIAAGFTQQIDVEAALDLVRTCPVVSLLLNKIRTWSEHSFGSYGHSAAQA